MQGFGQWHVIWNFSLSAEISVCSVNHDDVFDEFICFSRCFAEMSDALHWQWLEVGCCVVQNQWTDTVIEINEPHPLLSEFDKERLWQRVWLTFLLIEAMSTTTRLDHPNCDSTWNAMVSSQKTNMWTIFNVFPNLDWCSLVCAPCTAWWQTQCCVYRCLPYPLSVAGWVPPQPLTKAMGGR